MVKVMDRSELRAINEEIRELRASLERDRKRLQELTARKAELTKDDAGEAPETD